MYLHDNYFCMADSDFYSMYNAFLIKLVERNKGDFLFDINYFLTEDMDIYKKYIQGGLDDFGTHVRAIKNANQENFLAVTKFLNMSFVVAINKNNPYDKKIYTRSVERLKELISADVISNKDYLTHAMYALRSNRSEKGMKDNGHCCVRLDVVNARQAKPSFKMVVPKTRLNITSEGDYIFVPLFQYYVLAETLDYFMFRPTRVSYESRDSIKSKILCSSDNGLAEVYGVEHNDSWILKKYRYGRRSFSVATLRYYSLNAEGSLYDIDEANFCMEDLVSLEEVKKSDINTSLHHISKDVLWGIFKTGIRNLKAAQVATIDFFDMSGYANIVDAKAVLLKEFEKVDSMTLYNLLKRRYDLFVDLDKQIESRNRNKPKFMKEFKDISNKNVDLKDLLRKGALRITLLSQKGFMFERIASNNTQMLRRMLGKDYIAKYESDKVKLYELKNDIKRGLKQKEFNNKVNYYGLNNVIDPNEKKMQIAVQSAIENMAYTGGYDNTALIMRNLFAESKEEYFISLNLDNIVCIEYAEYKI